jgi:phage terminase large subunit-like protein
VGPGPAGALKGRETPISWRDSLGVVGLDYGALEEAILAASPTAGSRLLPHQVPPPPGWLGWLLTGGRGVGKTLAGSHWIADLARNVAGFRGRIIAPTLSDAVNGVVHDPDSGLLAYDSTAVYRPSGAEGVRVEWPNGSKVWCVGTNSPRDVDRLRALTNIDADLFEEAAANPQLASAAKQAALSRRGKRLPHPIWAATTTPRPLATIKEWMADEQVVVTRATTFDNPHTPDVYRHHAEALRGTRLYKQEVLGEIIDDVEGALWTLANLERSLYTGDRSRLVEGLVKVAIGVDPPSGSGTCGIIVVGRDDSGHLYVLDDYSVTDATPHQWAMRVASASADYGGLVVAEVNQGGRMVSEVLRQAAPGLPITTVHAAKGKQARAEPVALLWEAELQTAHMAPAAPDDLTLLTDQLTEWVPGEFSPDRLDAMVWAATYLLDKHEAVMHDPTRARGATVGAPQSFSAWRRGG